MGDDAAHVSVAPPRLPPITTMTWIAARHAFFLLSYNHGITKMATDGYIRTTGRQDMDENAWIQLSNGTASWKPATLASV